MWFDRVPSVSNVADGPSKGDFEGLDPSLRVVVPVAGLMEPLQALQEK